MLRVLFLALLFALTMALSAAGSLHTAATFGKLDEVKSLLAADPMLLKITDESGRTPLYCAATSLGFDGAPAVTAYLLERGADPNIADERGQTALGFLAGNQIQNQKSELAQKTVLKMRARRLKQIQLLLAHGADATATNKFGYTPLHGAIQAHFPTNPMIDVITLLLSKVDVNVPDVKGKRTPLHLAARNNAVDVATLLLAKGANVNAADADGQTPLHDAVTCVYQLVDGKPAPTPSRKPLIDLLIAKGAKVNAADALGLTPVHEAAQSSLDALQALLAKGGDLQAVSREGKTALHFAARGAGRNNAAVVKFLIAKGLNPTAMDKAGRTPLFDAVMINVDGAMAPALNPAINILVEKEGGLTRTDAEGNTLLHTAVGMPFYFSGEAMKFLVAMGANVNAKNRAGQTPLDLARKDKDMVAFLESCGAIATTEKLF